MIDECSLLSAELVSEIDAALRFAKEKPNLWFGGVMVIFAGDLYQYPPACMTSLYNPISTYSTASDIEIPKCLGCLAWKSINAVVNLTEQMRMKKDPEYATAVSHLHTRECTLEDVDLFNTRVIKSANNKTGINMSTVDNFEATAIVRTNLLRVTMNICKAETNCHAKRIHLVTCAAIDTCPTKELCVFS
jgi:hypothetical protein